MDPFMRMIVGLFTVLTVGALSQAMATDPPAEAPKAATSTSAPSSTTQASTTTSDKAASSSDGTRQVTLIAGDEAADTRLKKLRAAGYKTEMHGSDVVFCRKEPVLGTRFEHKVCHTAEELDNMSSNGRDTVETAQRNGLGVGNPKGN
jgi:hypothetical protein